MTVKLQLKWFAASYAEVLPFPTSIWYNITTPLWRYTQFLPSWLLSPVVENNSCNQTINMYWGMDKMLFSDVDMVSWDLVLAQIKGETWGHLHFFGLPLPAMLLQLQCNPPKLPLKAWLYNLTINKATSTHIGTSTEIWWQIPFQLYWITKKSGNVSNILQRIMSGSSATAINYDFFWYITYITGDDLSFKISLISSC